MRQHFLLDRPLRAVYLGLGAAVGLAGCHPAAPKPVVPLDIGPVGQAQVLEWVAATVPQESRLHKFKWVLQKERGSGGGAGAARIASPDTLRFDASDIYGAMETSRAVVIGDRSLWIVPADALEKLVPSYPLLWAMFGVARPPLPGMELRGLANDSLVVWRYALGADTVDYRRTRGRDPKFVAEVRRAGQVTGRVETTIGSDGAPRRAELLVPSVPAKLKLTFDSTERTKFAPETWQQP